MEIIQHPTAASFATFAVRVQQFFYKTKRGKQSAEFSGHGFKWDTVNLNLHLAGIGRMDIHWSRAFTSQPSTVTITKDCAGRYFVTLCLDEKVNSLPKTGKAVGVDLGINRLATLSNGERIANPRHTAKYAKKLARAQRVLSRRKKGSGRWNCQRIKVARLHARIADSRKDHLDKFTTDLVQRFDVITVEDLNVRGMLPNRTLSRSIGDLGLHQL